MTTSFRDEFRTLAAPAAEAASERGRTRRRRRAAWISRRTALVVLIQFLVLGSGLGLWELAVRRGWANEVFYSRPSVIWDQLVAYVTGPEIVIDSVTTIGETLLGFGLGAALGLPAGLLLGRYDFVRSVATPFFTALNALPRVALAPMFILWFGLGLESKIYLVASVVFFLVMVATEAGIRTIDPDFIMMGRAIGSTERDMFLKIVLPASVPALFSGLKLGAVYALLAAIFGEMLAADHGWGRKIALESQSFQPGSVFAVLVVVLAFALTLNSAMSALERRLLRWQE